MQFIPSLLFGVSVSLDALLVGIWYGVRSIHIRLWQNLFISLITLAGTCCALRIGSSFLLFMPRSFATILGSSVFIVYGIYYLLKFRLFPPAPVAEKTDASLPFSQALSLSIALSANNMGIGLSAGIAGLPVSHATAATFFFSFFFLFLGNRLGKCCRQKVTESKADFLAGILLIVLGIWECVCGFLS
ncbi:MAG: manganese efflux pump [Acetatifactor sp.]|nr:manganese efflux pump [Acetatifactor sp.]